MLFNCKQVHLSYFRRHILMAVGMLCLSLFPCAPAAEGAIIVSFGPSIPDPMIAGSSGTIDVLIRTDAGIQSLDGFQVQVELSGGPVGGLIFSAAQTEAQLGLASYAFSGISLSENSSAGIGIVGGGGSSYIGADATDDGSAIPFAGNPVPMTLTTVDRLLFQLNLDFITPGTYSIGVDPANSAFFYDQLDPLASNITFSSTPESLTVASSVAPEPSSITLFCLGSLFLMGRCFNRKK